MKTGDLVLISSKRGRDYNSPSDKSMSTIGIILFEKEGFNDTFRYFQVLSYNGTSKLICGFYLSGIT